MQIAIDYGKLIQQFGTKALDAELIARFERLTGRKAHRLIRRGIVFSHRCAAAISIRLTAQRPEHDPRPL